MNAASRKYDTDKGPMLPRNELETSYRLPFSFLRSREDMRQDVWNAVTPLFSRLQGMYGDSPTCPHDLHMPSSGPVDIFNNRDLIVIAWFSDSDLWIKICLPTHGPASVHELALSQLDRCIVSLDRHVYKYVFRNGSLKAFPNKQKQWTDHIKGYIGVDAGSISINTALVDEYGIVLETDYTLTEGDVLNNIKKSLDRIHAFVPENLTIHGAGVTGSGHEIAMAVLDADIYETELDAHAEAGVHLVPGAQVIFDIGGQDSKVMYIEDGMLDEAGMNKKCGAGTGAFLDAQAARLGIPIEDFGPVSLTAKKPYSFSSMCTVFVGRDLISEQAKGNTRENIIAGLHKSLAKNFFSTLGIDKKRLKTPIVFQGGVATNIGVKRALEECLEEARGERCDVIVPLFNNVMGAIGMALIARRESKSFGKSRFRGFHKASQVESEFRECERHAAVGCGNERICDLVRLYVDRNPERSLYACKEYYQQETQRQKRATND